MRIFGGLRGSGKIQEALKYPVLDSCSIRVMSMGSRRKARKMKDLGLQPLQSVSRRDLLAGAAATLACAFVPTTPIRLSPKAAEGMMIGPCSWILINATACRFRSLCLSSSGSFPTIRPARLTWRKLDGATDLSARTAEWIANHIGLPIAPVLFVAASACAIPG